MGRPGKRIFFDFFLIQLSLKNKKYFTFDILSKYEHITLKFVGRYVYWVVTIFSNKQGYFSTKIGEEKIRFRLFYNYKKSYCPLRGGGFNGPDIKRRTLFCVFHCEIKNNACNVFQVFQDGICLIQGMYNVRELCQFK